MDAGGGRDDVLLCVFAFACDVVDGVELRQLGVGVFLDVCVDDDGEFPGSSSDLRPVVFWTTD